MLTRFGQTGFNPSHLSIWRIYWNSENRHRVLEFHFNSGDAIQFVDTGTFKEEFTQALEWLSEELNLPVGWADPQKLSGYKAEGLNSD